VSIEGIGNMPADSKVLLLHFFVAACGLGIRRPADSNALGSTRLLHSCLTPRQSSLRDPSFGPKRSRSAGSEHAFGSLRSGHRHGQSPWPGRACGVAPVPGHRTGWHREAVPGLLPEGDLRSAGRRLCRQSICSFAMTTLPQPHWVHFRVQGDSTASAPSPRPGGRFGHQESTIRRPWDGCFQVGDSYPES
jgi:hypothetical protein